MINAVRDRLNGGAHGGMIVPIVLLEKDSYPHKEYGRVWYPVLTIVGWMPLEGPAPTPAPKPEPSPSTSAADQPRRRRVG
jgi:hypothetical protein